MSVNGTNQQRLERLLARLLSYGTWLASAVIAVGFILTVMNEFESSRMASLGARIVTIGIALLIALPVGRVVSMLLYYLYMRDYRISAITALVLGTMIAGFVLGLLRAFQI